MSVHLFFKSVESYFLQKANDHVEIFFHHLLLKKKSSFLEKKKHQYTVHSHADGALILNLLRLVWDSDKAIETAHTSV